MADRFYSPDPIALGDFVLAGADAHHMTAVRRFAPGDHVVLFHGDGFECPAEVVAVDKKRVHLVVHDRIAVGRESAVPVVVGVALPKADRADFLIEKLVEVGVTRFVPLSTMRGVVKTTEAKTDKLARAVIEASKQCGRNVFMKVDPPTPLAMFLNDASLPSDRRILHTSEVHTAKHQTTDASLGIAFAIGPEGGFADEEVSTAVKAGWRPLSLGPRVLRVETAAIVAATLAIISPVS